MCRRIHISWRCGGPLCAGGAYYQEAHNCAKVTQPNRPFCTDAKFEGENRDCCCSARCCQAPITNAQREFESWETYFGIPRGGTWKDKTAHRERSKALYEKARAKMNNAIREHSVCLARFIDGLGFTNQIRAACKMEPLPIPRIRLPALPNGGQDINLPKEAEGFDALQQAYERSTFGQDDLLRYNAFCN